MTILTKKFALSVFLLLPLALLNPFQSKAQCNVQDSLALVDFYYAANGPAWTNQTNWLTTRVQDWYGVDMANMVGHPDRVWVIVLPNNNLAGTITPSVSQLKYLFALTLFDNYLTGSLPADIGNTTITSIDLHNNSLTDPLPLSLGNSDTNNLGDLDISNNDFGGAFPDTIISNPHLTHLTINDNHFTSIGNDHYLVVRLQNNKFTFKDLIYYRNINGNNIVAPQDSIYETMDTNILVGSTFVMDSWADTCASNRYTWYKYATWLNWDSPVSTLTITNAQVSNSGTYYCRVANPSQCSNVFLWRRPIHLTVALPSAVDPQPTLDKSVSLTYKPAEQMLDISFRFNKETPVAAYLYDECGRSVLRLFDGETTQQDLHQYVGWMKKGIYIVRVIAGKEVLTRKIVI